MNGVNCDEEFAPRTIPMKIGIQWDGECGVNCDEEFAPRTIPVKNGIQWDGECFSEGLGNWG